MTDPIIVVPYNPVWVAQFKAIAHPIRQALGDTALYIHHIGSTAVPNLAAKPVIDIQILVSDFEPFDEIQQPIEAIGYQWRSDNPDLTKLYFRETGNMPRTHIHMRRVGSWSAEFALLFRDYLRANHEDCEKYAKLKFQLADKFRHHRNEYVEAKSPLIWEIMQRANKWSQETGWRTSPSDA